MVGGLELRDVVVRYGQTTAVDGVSLHLPKGSSLSLVGASGSGKSSLLRAIIGLEPLASGSVRWDGKDISQVKVHKRRFGIVFQDSQLFPTLDVAGNIAYGLHALTPAGRRKRVAEMLELVDLAGFDRRKVGELSGGEAQRVALARSLAPRPRALMLDEPFSALDRSLRERLAQDTARILRRVGITTVHVTHDQDEAFTMADTVAVLHAGQVLQHAEPEELWSRPASRAVASFLGARAFIDQATAGQLGWPGTLPPGHLLGIGARSLVLDPGGLEVRILSQGFAPEHVEVHVALPDGQRAMVASQERIHEDTVRVRLTGGPVVPGAEVD